MKKTSSSKPEVKAAFRFAGNDHGLHTLVSVVVRSIEFEETPAARMVKVTATMGESEAKTEVVRFRLTEREALNVNILERVCRHCGGTDIRVYDPSLYRMVSVQGTDESAGVCFGCHREWRA